MRLAASRTVQMVASSPATISSAGRASCSWAAAPRLMSSELHEGILFAGQRRRRTGPHQGVVRVWFARGIHEGRNAGTLILGTARRNSDYFDRGNHGPVDTAGGLGRIGLLAKSYRTFSGAPNFVDFCPGRPAHGEFLPRDRAREVQRLDWAASADHERDCGSRWGSPSPVPHCGWEWR